MAEGDNMAQPVAYPQFTYIGTVGTVLLTDRPDAAIIRAIEWGTFVGTVMLYDSSTTGGTSASNVIGTLGIPMTSVAGAVELGFRVKNGIVYTSTGTPNITLVWD